MSFIDKLQEVLSEQQIRDLENEGFRDIVKTGIKLLPAFAMMFQLLTASPEAAPAPKNDIMVALIDMQESKSQSELDSTSKQVVDLISTLKGEKRNSFINVFKKAYKETESKVVNK